MSAATSSSRLTNVNIRYSHPAGVSMRATPGSGFRVRGADEPWTLDPEPRTLRRMLYLHEIIDIVGTGQEKYMQTVIERDAYSQGENISRLAGCWKVIGSTNRWPRVVNLWEMDSWAHWAGSLERQFLPQKIDRELAPWWAKATEWRSGGFDRILEPAAYSPD